MSNPKDPGGEQPARDRRIALLAICGLALATAPAFLALRNCSGSTAPKQEIASPVAPVTPAPVNAPPQPPPVPPDSVATHTNGLVQLTPEQEEAVDKSFPVVNQVDMNSLALERLNAERKAKGLPPIEAPTAAPGQEIHATTNAVNAPTGTNPPP